MTEVASTISVEELVKEVRRVMSEGLFDPQDIFNQLYPQYRVHYNTIRHAIHLAKTRSY